MTVRAIEAREPDCDPLGGKSFRDLRELCLSRHHESGYWAGIAGVYNRAVYMDERRRALEAWAKLVTSPAADSSNVVVVLRAAEQVR